MIATPVIFENVVYIANGQDPEHGEGVGHLYAIDATKRGDITTTGQLWHYDKIRRTISTASIKDGIIYYPDFSGFLHALDVKTGKPFWVHDMFAAMWSSTMVADGKVYLGDEDGDVVVIQHGGEEAKKILAENAMDSSVYSTVDHRQRRDVRDDDGTTCTRSLKGRRKNDTPVECWCCARALCSSQALRAGTSVTLVTPQAVPVSSWPQFRNTPTLTGVSPSTLPATLKVLWTYDAGGAVESSAAIVDGTVYVGASTGELLALDLASGKAKWKYRAANPDFGIGESSPAVAAGVVYIGDLTGVLHAVDAATGKVRWTFKTGSEIKSSPVVAGNRVLIGSYDGSLYALDVATGKQVWKVETENYVHATPAIWNGVAYFGGCDEIFHGVRISDGVEVVRMSTGAYTAASAAIAGGVAYYGTFANDVVAVDIAAKRVKWRFEDPDRQFPFYSSAAISNGLAILGGRDKMVRAIDLATGKQRWSFATRARVESSPAVAGDRVVVGSSDGKVYVLDVASGKKVWEFESGAGFTASPAIGGGRIVIGDVDGRIYSIG